LKITVGAALVAAHNNNVAAHNDNVAAIMTWPRPQ